MQSIKIRFALDLTLTAKKGWTFEFNDDGELILTSPENDSLTPADRDTLIKEMIAELAQKTKDDANLPWFVVPANAEIDVELP